jgi:hypothetical protein
MNYSVEQFNKDLEEPYAWPGGYPRYFITSDGEALSYKAAREEARQIRDAIESNSKNGWCVVGCDVNWEDQELTCAHTDERIECAYPPDEKPEHPERMYRIEHFAPLYEPASAEHPREFFSEVQGFDSDDQQMIDALRIGERARLPGIRITRLADSNDAESSEDIEWDMHATHSRIGAADYMRNGRTGEDRASVRAGIREELRDMRELQMRHACARKREQEVR